MTYIFSMIFYKTATFDGKILGLIKETSAGPSRSNITDSIYSGVCHRMTRGVDFDFVGREANAHEGNAVWRTCVVVEKRFKEQIVTLCDAHEIVGGCSGMSYHPQRWDVDGCY